MKTKLCKCSHLKADHSKYFKLCDKCQCSDFVKSKSGLDKLMMGYYITMIGMMVVLSIMMFVLIDSMSDEYMDQVFIITPTDSGATTVGNMFDALMYAIFAISFLMSAIQFSAMFDEIKDSRRKDYN
jgi:hypothetical protein